jgi:hypothetical protein
VSSTTNGRPGFATRDFACHSGQARFIPQEWHSLPRLGDRFERWVVPVLLAATMTGLNALKPPCIDDPAYLAIARQVAAHPLDPYGFDQFWYERPQPANEILAPPVLPYWLALGMRIFGEEIFLLKLWLFPIALLLAIALRALLARFAPGVETPVLVGLVLSPAILPGFNFMLDVPALALSLSAIVVFFRGLDRGSWALALLAGVLAGLAAQTKYTGGVCWPLLLAAAALWRRPLLGIAAVTVAAGLFAGWEAFTAFLYGESHLRVAMTESSESILKRSWLAFCFLQLTGALGIPIALLALAALGRRPLWVIAGILATISTFAALLLYPDNRYAAWPVKPLVGFGLPRILFGVWGTALYFLIVLAVTGLVLRRRPRRLRVRLRRPVALLLIWLTLEVAGYAVLTPFPAARRITGTLVVATLLVAHFASRTCRKSRERRAVWLAAVGSAALGLIFAGIDVADSRLEPTAIHSAAEYIRAHDANARVWFTGHWGTQYAAQREEFQPLVPGQSLLREGDWVIVAPAWVAQQNFDETVLGEPVHTVVIDRELRLRTLPPSYGGSQCIEWWPAPMLELRVYRVAARRE